MPQGAQRLPHLARLPVLDHCLRPERFLALEMVVERALWHTRRFGNVLHAGAVEAPAVQGVETRREELFANVESGHGNNMTGRLGIRKPLRRICGLSS